MWDDGKAGGDAAGASKAIFPVGPWNREDGWSTQQHQGMCSVFAIQIDIANKKTLLPIVTPFAISKLRYLVSNVVHNTFFVIYFASKLHVF